MMRDTLFAVSRLRSRSMYSDIRCRSATAGCDHSTRMRSGAFPLFEPCAYVSVGNCFASVGGHHAVSHFASEPFVVGYEVVNRLSQQFVRAPVGSLGQFIESSLRLGRQI